MPDSIRNHRKWVLIAILMTGFPPIIAWAVDLDVGATINPGAAATIDTSTEVRTSADSGVTLGEKLQHGSTVQGDSVNSDSDVNSRTNERTSQSDNDRYDKRKYARKHTDDDKDNKGNGIYQPHILKNEP